MVQKRLGRFENVKDNETSIAAIRKGLEEAVHRQMMSDVPYGVLLSGGLDSSIISAIAAKYAKKNRKWRRTKAWYPRLHSFAVGLEGSPDLLAGKKQQNILVLFTTKSTFTVQEGLDAVRDVIYHLETYDVTTVELHTNVFNGESD